MVRGFQGLRVCWLYQGFPPDTKHELHDRIGPEGLGFRV